MEEHVKDNTGSYWTIICIFSAFHLQCRQYCEEILSIMPSKTTRSRVTNGKALFLERVDGRSLTARRYRDLYQAFIADLGGMATVSEA